MENNYKLSTEIKELKISGDEIEDLLNRIPVGIYRSRLDGSIVFANKFFRDLFELEEGSKIEVQHLSYDREEFFSLIKSCGYVEDFTAQVTLKNGKVLHTIESAKAIYNENGEIEYVEGILTDITKYKSVQDALTESEEKYRLLFEQSDDPILLIDGDKWVDCNAAAIRVLGLKSKSELIGLSPYDISPPTQPDMKSSKDKALQYIRDAYLNGYKRFDWVHTTRDGREIYVDVSLTAIPYHKRVLLFTVFRDISHKIEAERRLRESEEKFRLVFQNISDGILLINDQGDIIDANDAIENITGKKKHEFLYKKIWDFSTELVVSEFYVSNEEIFKNNLNKLLQNQKSQLNETELVIKRKDGSYAFININQQIFRSSQGIIICEIIKDITDLKRTTEALIKQKELYETLARTTPISVFLIDFDGRILFANDETYSFFNQLNFDFNEIKTVYDLINEFDYDKLSQVIKIILKQGYIRNFEIQSRPFNGKIIEVEINASLVYDNYGNPTSIIATVMDVGTRKQTERIREKALRATIEAAEARQEALEIIHNSAQLASIGVIAGGIVHEISQPLNAIRIGAEGILSWNTSNNNPLPSAVVNMIQGISRATLRIDEIIQHMRTLWLGSSSENLEIIDLNSCVKSAMNLTKMRVQSHEIIFETMLCEEKLPLQANKVHIELIINNLITNAVNSLDLTDRQNKTIRIITKSSGKYAYLIVYDNGIGLPNVRMEKLFDPFFSTRQNSGGTGLGLAIVKMFVDKYNGYIQPMNNEDGGATFIINFPLFSEGEK